MPPEPLKAEPSGILRVPPTAVLRDRIRAAAASAVSLFHDPAPPDRARLETEGRLLLRRLAAPECYLGFAMVALNNAFWRPAFAAVPFDRRLFLLPHCLRDRGRCAGTYDPRGLHCAGCGSCPIGELKARAEALGYRVLVAEGTGAVTGRILEEELDAVLGVACLESLEKSFARVRELGIPHLAVPLLRDGCADTRADLPVVEELLRERRRTAARATTYLPLLREARRIFESPGLDRLLGPALGRNRSDPGGPPGNEEAETLGLEWLRRGGKRLRPFATLAAYAVARHGRGALASDADLKNLLPTPVRRLALAVETFHKASLIHDDIEDDSPYRYGRPAMHVRFGLPTALNVGDYLIGLGYHLVAIERRSLGAACVSDILNRLSLAHLQLCQGQGIELRSGRDGKMSPREVLSLQALKTAPAFEAALYAGLRAAGAAPRGDLLRRFSVLLGEGYQILNDLEDWNPGAGGKVHPGGDAVLIRPTILRAFALEAGGSEILEEADRASEKEERLGITRRIFAETGAFDKARELLRRLRERALETAGEFSRVPLRDLFSFLVRVILDHGGT